VNHRKIPIMGLPGAGNATLANALAPLLNAPLAAVFEMASAFVPTPGRLASRLSALNKRVDAFIAVQLGF
jgi:adenylate kinase family enzyme